MTTGAESCQLQTEHPGNRTPERTGIQHGRHQASPFSLFAAHLSPITPSKAANNTDWQPTLVSPAYETQAQPRGETSEHNNRRDEAHSGEKSSLRSSYETSVSALDHLLTAEQDPSSAMQPEAAEGPFPTAGKASKEASKAPSVAKLQANHSMQLGAPGLQAMLANRPSSGQSKGGPSEAAGLQTIAKQLAQPRQRPRKPTPLCSPSSETSSSPQQSPAQTPPASPFAALASKRPPPEWGGPNSAKRKQMSSDESSRPRKRTLTFPPNSQPPQDPQGLPLAAMSQASQSERQAGSIEVGIQGTPKEITSPPGGVGPSSAPSGNVQAGASAAHLPPGQSAQPKSGISLPPANLARAPNVAPKGGVHPMASMPYASFPAPSCVAQPQQMQMTSAMAAAMAAGPHARPAGLQSAAIAAAAAAPRRYGCQVPKRPQTNRKQEKEAAAAAGQKRCNCKKSRCLKLYCDCFAAGQFCLNCTCTMCSNTPECRDAVMEMRETIQARNSSAFDTKVIQSVETAAGAVVNQHKKGCHCKKSNCKKKYCECFQAGVNCGQHCKCENCHNQSEHGLPGPKKGSRGAKADALKSAAAKEASTSLSSDQRRPPRRSCKRPAQSSGLDPDESLLVDTGCKSAGGGMALLEDKGLPGFPAVKEESLATLCRPLPRTASALSDLSFKQARAVPMRSGSGNVLLSGSTVKRLGDSAGELLKGQESYLGFPLPAKLPRPGVVDVGNESGPVPEDLLSSLQEISANEDLQLRLGLPVGNGSFLAAVQSPSFPDGSVGGLSFGLDKDLHALDDIRAQGPLFGNTEHFGLGQEEGMHGAGPMSAATQWTENRLEDLETGEGMQFNLESILMTSDLPPAFEEGGLFLSHELDPNDHSSPDHDENVAPLSRMSGGLQIAYPSPLAGLKGSPASQQTKARLPTPGRIRSPSRNPFGPPLQASGNAIERALADDEADTNRLESAISLRPSGLPALREHRPDPPPGMPQTGLKRSRSGELFQDVLAHSLEGGFFHDAFMGADLGGDSLAALDALGSATMTSLGHLPRKLGPGSPLTGGFSPASDAGFEPLTFRTGDGGVETGESAPIFRPTAAAIAAGLPSPSRSVYVHSAAGGKTNSGFVRLTAGSTIFSPPKSC